MSALLQREIADYTARRDRLVSAILDFSDWLDRHRGMDVERNLRLLDTADALKKDRLTLAFVAEFSRGKTELINALFFADYGCRLLPSDAGRTTMCPTEIYFDPQEEPGLRLLPIESRLGVASLAHLKLRPVEWSRIKLDPDQPEEMARILGMLSEVKHVAPGDARALGLSDENDLTHISHEDGTVEIPAWRYAMLNIPHPLLEAGLTILDTPGLNALGAEPELTLSAIPSAHAVLFLLAADSGVTKSDLEIWQKYVQCHANYHVAVLNKIDMLWDELKSDAETRDAIQRQMTDTARILNLPINQVFSISAQKALVGKVKKDADLIARSGVMNLEQVMGNTIIPARREIVTHAALAEIGAMLGAQRERLAGRMRAVVLEWQDLSGLTGKSKDAIQKMRERMVKDKERYEVAADEFKLTRSAVMLQGDELRHKLDLHALDELLSEAHARMEGRWTTNGLIRKHARRGRSGQEPLFQGQPAVKQCENLSRSSQRALPPGAWSGRHGNSSAGARRLRSPDPEIGAADRGLLLGSGQSAGGKTLHDPALLWGRGGRTAQGIQSGGKGCGTMAAHRTGSHHGTDHGTQDLAGITSGQSQANPGQHGPVEGSHAGAEKRGRRTEATAHRPGRVGRAAEGLSGWSDAEGMTAVESKAMAAAFVESAE